MPSDNDVGAGGGGGGGSLIGTGSGSYIPAPAGSKEGDLAVGVTKGASGVETMTIYDTVQESDGKLGESAVTSYTLDASDPMPVTPSPEALSALVTFSSGVYTSGATAGAIGKDVAMVLNAADNGTLTEVLNSVTTPAGTSATKGPGGTGGMGNPYFAGNPMVAIAIAMLIMFSTMRRSQLETGLTGVKELQVQQSLAQCAATLTVAASQAEAAGDTAQGTAALVSGCVQGAVALASLASPGEAQSAYNKEVGVQTKAVMEDGASCDSMEEDLEDESPTAAACQNDRAEIARLNNKIESDDYGDDGVSTDGEGTTKEQDQQSLKEAKERLKANQEKLADENPAYKKRLDKFNKDSDKLDNLNSAKGEAEFKSHFMQQQAARLKGFSEMLTGISNGLGSFAQASAALAKGEAQGRASIVQAYLGMVQSLSKALADTYNNTGSAMDSLIQALNKIIDSTAQSTGIHPV